MSIWINLPGPGKIDLYCHLVGRFQAEIGADSIHNFFYEFFKGDIAYVEELPSIVNLDGETVSMVRVWIKKMSIGMRCSPFIVEDTAAEPQDNKWPANKRQFKGL